MRAAKPSLEVREAAETRKANVKTMGINEWEAKACTLQSVR